MMSAAVEAEGQEEGVVEAWACWVRSLPLVEQEASLLVQEALEALGT